MRDVRCGYSPWGACQFRGMQWYVVIKTINGRRYYYRQKTWREGKRVRTRSEYIGPVTDCEWPEHSDTTGAQTLAIPFPQMPAIDIAKIADELLEALRDSRRTYDWNQPWDETKSD